jgi:TetR/AcrR family transcriptional regulator, cholesterol catabolism regulator
MQEALTERTPISERLLPAAAALFREKGYAGTSIRDLAGVLGIQTASLYHYISGKEDLLEAVCVASVERLHQRMRDALAREGDPLLRLRLVTQTFISDILIDDRDMHAVAHLECRWLSPERLAAVRAQLDRFVALLTEVIAEAQGSGALRRDIPARHLARALQNLLAWSMVWFRPGGEFTASQLGELFEKLFLEGSLPRAAAEPCSALEGLQTSTAGRVVPVKSRSRDSTL